MLLIYFIFIYFLFNFRKTASPGLLLISIYIISITSGYFIDQDYYINSYFKAFNLLFLAGILTIFILPWNKYNYNISISEPNPIVLRRWTLILLFVNGIAFLVFISIFYQAYTAITDFESFKNSGGDRVFIDDLNINHTLLLFSMYFHKTAYFLIPIHLHYLIKNRFGLSFLSFLFSLNIGLFGLTVFSRSGIVEYLFVYAFYLPFFSDGIKKKIKHFYNKKLIIISVVMGIVFFGSLMAFFYKITENRFENATVKSESFIKNPQIYSLFDYSSQWLTNSNEVMSTYAFETLNGELLFPLVQVTANKLQLIDYPEDTIDNKLYAIWGNHYNSFNGLVANLLFDLGYIGTICFALLYMLVLRIFKPVRGKITFNALLVLGVVFIIPAMGIFNSQMRSFVYNALIIYSIIMCMYIYVKNKIRKQNYCFMSAIILTP